MDLEKEEIRIKNLIFELENESAGEDTDVEEPIEEDDGSEHSDADDLDYRNEDNQLDIDTEESAESENEEDLQPQVQYYIGKNGTTKWSSVPVQNRCQTRAHNIVTRLPGPVGAARNAKNPLESFMLFFTKGWIDKVVHYTNTKIRSVQPSYSRDRDARETDYTEISAYFGVLLMLGVTKSNKTNLYDVWRKDGLGIEIFRYIMGVNRFKFLQQMIRFDDISDPNRLDRKRGDKLFCVRELFEEFVLKCKQNYSHSVYVTVDEMLPNFRGRCSFRVFMPQKPGKYGLKVWACTDAKTYYTSNMEIFVGNQHPGPQHVSNTMAAVVQRIVSHLENSGRNITCDNLFTSVPLAHCLLQKNLTMVGTMRKNKGEIPPLFVTKGKNRPAPSSMFGFSSQSTLVSYKPKPSKVVVLLSTMHNDDKIDEESCDSQKPAIVTFYNKTKIGVDIADALQKKYSVSRIARRWPLAVFYFMLNVGGINSFIIFRHLSQQNLKRKDYLFLLGKELAQDHCKRRLYESNISTTVKSRICEIFSLPRKRPADDLEEAQDVVEGKCNYCPLKKNRKTKTRCNSCQKFICREHTKATCTKCHHNTQTDEEEA